MADTKISQLPAATTPLSGAEVVPLVQSGATVQTPVNELSLLTAATANTFTANQIISVTDNTNAALRVTQLGTGLALRIEDETNPDSTPVVVDASGNVGIGTASPANKLDVFGAIAQVNGPGGSKFVAKDTTGAGNAAFSIVEGKDSGGTSQWYVGKPDSTSVVGLVNSISGGNIILQTTGGGNVLVPGTGGLGYGTGSGGTVTQLTSRTTGVTLNKTNGSITLFSAPNSTTFRSFTVTNSTVAATDTIVVSQRSGTDRQQILVTAVAAGSFELSVATTSGTTSEAPVINFAVIKAVTS